MLKDEEERANYDYMLDNPGESVVLHTYICVFLCVYVWWKVVAQILQAYSLYIGEWSRNVAVHYNYNLKTCWELYNKVW